MPWGFLKWVFFAKNLFHSSRHSEQTKPRSIPKIDFSLHWLPWGSVPHSRGDSFPTCCCGVSWETLQPGACCALLLCGTPCCLGSQHPWDWCRVPGSPVKDAEYQRASSQAFLGILPAWPFAGVGVLLSSLSSPKPLSHPQNNHIALGFCQGSVSNRDKNKPTSLHKFRVTTKLFVMQFWICWLIQSSHLISGMFVQHKNNFLELLCS